MADTTLTLDSNTKARLKDYRHADHDSWTDMLEGMMKMLPSIEDIQNGCVNCEKTPFVDAPSEDLHGFIQWFHHEWDETRFYNAHYYCSDECVRESAEQIEKYLPEHPDLVRVGGNSELVAEVEGASFYIDGTVTEVGIPLPGAFSGTSSHGDEYDYIGEPVYLKNEGEWVHSGVITDIIHEDAHTALILGADYDVEMSNHPDEERRNEHDSSKGDC